ncbi:hypothetical protein EV426DRAFT_713984 [Tirmania nivea]|nr:hypothetical protein EV426DRAFT_713984 [Tirmania nivea]
MSSECGKRSSIQGSSSSDPMVIDVGPQAVKEKSTEHKPSPQTADNATEASPKGKKRGKTAREKAENTKRNDNGPSVGKKAKAQAKSPPPRKLPAKRAKKNNSTTEGEHSARSTSALPSPLGYPKLTPPKQAASQHKGRQHAGSYTRAEVRALQTWINNSIRDDWNTIVQEVGKATGVYRNVDNLRTFYGTVVLRQMYDSFPNNGGEHGTIVAADMSVCDGGDDGKVGKVCGSCGAVLVEGTKDEEVKEKAAENTEQLRPTGGPI